eukprot:361775-Chlamydomonas_euryale.AAC.6
MLASAQRAVAEAAPWILPQYHVQCPAPQAHDLSPAVTPQDPRAGSTPCQVWWFFKDRIQYEEVQLMRMFPGEYADYRACTPTWFPFIP